MHFFRSSSAYALRAFLLTIHASFLIPFVSIIGLITSLALFRTALERVLKAPMSFFDTTPMGSIFHFSLSRLSIPFSGRIISRLSKDQDTLDGELPMLALQASPLSNRTI
jgi:ATP-binding cassette, subfamily C (CFTR/MRP), member 1